jgi:hypothetical protein
MSPLARLFIFLGLAFLVIGGLIYLAGRVNLPLGRLPALGRLPGDIRIVRENFACFIPIATSIILSIVLTVLLNLALRWLGRK